VDGLCDDFERRWRRARRRGEQPPLAEDFLARAPESARAALAPALAALERELAKGDAWPGVPGYECLGEIARGPMGIVYRVRRSGREWALKALQSAALALWAGPGEGELLTGLRHPHIVPVECFGEHAGLPYLVMPLVEGGDLRQRMGEFKGSRAADLMAKVADAVAYLHGRGVLHRDLKPSNILLTLAGEPLVCDFGLALRLAESATGPALVGTLAYMAPEQREGRAVPASDVWSLGAILRELAGDDAGLLLAAGRCLRDDPAGRPTACELAGMLHGS
jgi:serine/threonine protein kinase